MLFVSRHFYGIFMRTLWALCSLRKVSLALIVQNVSQVNVCAEQVEVAAPEQ
jgi:hypothetical protein